MKRRRTRPGERAVVLVLVLWVLVLLAVVGLALAQNTRLNNAVRVAVKDRVTARWLARAGVTQAAARMAGAIGDTDTIGDAWYDDEEQFARQSLGAGSWTVYAGRGDSRGSARYGVTDECSKLNLNTATPEMLARLPEMTESVVDAIVAYRDEAAMGGGGLGRYAAVATVRGLGGISGIDSETLYGEDRNFNGVLDPEENDGEVAWPADDRDDLLDRGLGHYVTVYSFTWNRDAQGDERLDVTRADEDELMDELGLPRPQALWIVERVALGPRSIADLLGDSPPALPPSRDEIAAAEGSLPLDVATFRRIADRITVTGEEVLAGRVNVNTAGEEVLAALPGVDASLAARIVEERDQLGQGFASVAELLGVDEMTVGRLKELAPYVCVRSAVFSVRSLGRAERTGMVHEIEAVLARNRGELSVLYWRETN